jgi:hypothetical protein
VLPPSIDFAALVAASPPDWIAATGSDAPTLAGALARDYAAWSALIRQ